MVVACGDTETYVYDENTKLWKPNLNARNFVLGVLIIDKRKTPLFFYKAEDYYDYLLDWSEKLKKEGHKIYLYFHNSSFDVAGIFREHLEENKLRIFSQKPFFGIFNDNLYILDTMGFTRNESKKSLKELGDKIGIKKLEMPEEVKEIKEIKPYCYNDANILMKFIKSLPDEIENAGFPRPKRILTAGNLAMSCFKSFIRNPKNCNYKGLPYSSYLYRRGTIHQTKQHEFIRHAQRGARNECFKVGEFNNVTSLDVCSMYPYVMASKIYPDPLSEQRINDPEELYSKEELLEKMGVVEATVVQPKCKIGYLPIRKEGKGIFFPYSENKEMQLTGWWTTFEINRAIEEGYTLLRIHKGVFYRPLPFNPFKEFVEKLYKLRKDSTGISNLTIKLLMNSLSLKFSQFKGEKLRQICHRQDVLEWENKGYEIEVDYGEKFMMTKEGEPRLPNYANPIFSIYILAYGRDELYKGLKKVDFKDLLYCDTDSVMMLNFDKYKNKFNIGNELGQWKIEFENVDAEFIKEKVYRIKDKIVTSGSRNLTQEQLEGKEKYDVKRMYSFNMGFKTGNFEKVGTFFNVENKIKPEFRKRLIKFPEIYREFTKDDLIENSTS